jgi:hydroxymethylbilane synthase
MISPLRIGTRGSRLALWQANHVAGRLQQLAHSPPIEIVEIETTGDQAPDAALTEIGGQGAFTKEIQRALLDNRVDLAVHSLKDLPTWPVVGLTLAAVPERGPVGDAFVSRRHNSFDLLPCGATIATGSIRRQAQLRHRRPDLKVVAMRGNVETRLRKMDEEGLDGIILAQAGLERLGLAGVVRELLDPSWFLPAVGQGALGLECRSDDRAVFDIVARLDHIPTHQCVTAERALLRHLGGGCQVPVGVLTQITDGMLRLYAVVLDADGAQRLEEEKTNRSESAEDLGRAVAIELLDNGAGTLLNGSSSAR